MSLNNADDFHAQQQAPTAYVLQSRRPGMLLVNGRFELVKPLGGGGMGEVWEAVDRNAAEHGNDQADGEVALKFLPSPLAGHPAMLQQFQKTFASLRKVQGRYLCPLYDMQVDDRVGHFIVMKRVHGHDLADVVRRQGPLPLDKAVPIIEWAAAGLDELHEQRFAHRDVKPENIMLAMNDSIKLQIIDYGVSGEIRESVARCSNMGFEGGTFIYMAPERWVGKRGGPPADQYALACVAYFLLTGHPPFEGTENTLRWCHLEQPVDPIAGLSAEVNGVLLRSLAKSPDERFSSCGEFARALRAAATGVPPPIASDTQSVVLPRRNVPPPPRNDTNNVAAGNTRPAGIVLPRRRTQPTAPVMSGGATTAVSPGTQSQTYPSGVTSDGTPGFAPVAAPVSAPAAVPAAINLGHAAQQPAFPSINVASPVGHVARSSSPALPYSSYLALLFSIELASLGCWLVGTLIVLLADPDPVRSSTLISTVMLLSSLACLLGAIAFSVSSLAFYGIAWSAVPDGDARQPTSVAIALMFVPVFNIYWFYRWQFSLLKRLNASLQAARSYHPPIGAELIWLQLIPFVGLVMCFVFQASVISAFRELRRALAPSGT